MIRILIAAAPVALVAFSVSAQAPPDRTAWKALHIVCEDYGSARTAASGKPELTEKIAPVLAVADPICDDSVWYSNDPTKKTLVSKSAGQLRALLKSTDGG